MVVFSGCGISEYRRYPVCIENCIPKATPTKVCVPTWDEFEVCRKAYDCGFDIDCKENASFCKECCEEKITCKTFKNKVGCE